MSSISTVSTMIAKGVRVITVGIGRDDQPIAASREVLTNLASAPRDQNTFLVPQIYGLETDLGSMLFDAISENNGFTCHAFGNQHIITTDGLEYTFKANGVFYLYNAPGVVDVQVLAGKCNEKGSCIRAFGVNHADSMHKFVVYAFPEQESFQIYVDDNFVPTSLYNDYGITMTKLYPEGNYKVTYYQNDFVSYVLYISKFGINVKLSTPPAGFLASDGLCGTFNDCQGDDLQLPTGVNASASDVSEFVKSQVVDKDSVNFDYRVVNLPAFGNVETVDISSASDKDACKDLPEAIRNACDYDVAVAEDDAIAQVSKNIVFSECLSYCAGGAFRSRLVSASQCVKFCPAPHLEYQTDLFTITNDTAYLPETEVSADLFTKIARIYQEDPINGTRFLLLAGRDEFGRTVEKKVYFRFECENPAPEVTVSELVNVNVSVYLPWPQVNLEAKVESGQPIKRIEWLLHEYPGTEAPKIFLSNGTNPYFFPTSVGSYIMQAIVYDGCQITKSNNVTVQVGCPNAAVEAPTSFIKAHDSLIMSDGSIETQVFTFETLSGELDVYEWTIDEKNAIILQEDGLMWEHLPDGEIYIYRPEVEELMNSTTMSDGFDQDTDTDTTNAVPPLKNELSRRDYYWKQKTTVTTNTTSQIDFQKIWYKIKPRQNVCFIEQGTDILGRFSLHMEDQIQNGCHGIYPIKLTYGNKCGNKTDVAKVTVGCGPRPHSIISYCNLDRSPNTCSASRFEPLLNSATLTVKFDYEALEFGSLVLNSRESFDDMGRTITKSWNVSGHPEELYEYLPNDFLEVENENYAAFAPFIEGDYRVALTVDNKCNNHTDYVTVRAECPEACTGGIAVNNSRTTLSLGPNNADQSFVFLGTASNATCKHLRSADWTIDGTPLIYNETNLVRSIIGVPPVNIFASNLGPNQKVEPYTLIPRVSGTYTVGLTISDGCKIVKSTQQVSTTCRAALDFNIIAPAFINANPNTGGYGTNLFNLSIAGNSTGQYWFLSHHNDVELLQYLGSGMSLNFSPDSSGVFDIFVYVTDGCNFVKKTFRVTATCPFLTGTPDFTSQNGYELDMPLTVSGFELVSSWQSSAFDYSWSVRSAPFGSNAMIFSSSANVTFVPDRPGEYFIQMTVFDACNNAYVSAQKRFNVGTDYDIVLATSIQSPLVVVSTSTDPQYPDQDKFPTVRLSAQQTFLRNVTYDSLRDSAYWYVVSAPKYSVYKGYSVEFEYAQTADLSFTSNTTVQSLDDHNVIESTFRNTLSTVETKKEVLTYLNSECTNSASDQLFPVCFKPDMPGEYKLQLRAFGLFGETHELSAPVTIQANCGSQDFTRNIVQNLAVTLESQGRLSISDDQIVTSLRPHSTTYKGFQMYQVVTDPNNATIQNTYTFNVFNDHDEEISFYLPISDAQYFLQYTGTDNCHWAKNNITLDVKYPNKGEIAFTAFESLTDFVNLKHYEISSNGSYIYVLNIKSGFDSFVEFVTKFDITSSLREVSAEFGVSEEISGTVFASNESQGVAGWVIAVSVIGALVGAALLVTMGVFGYRSVRKTAPSSA